MGNGKGHLRDRSSVGGVMKWKLKNVWQVSLLRDFDIGFLLFSCACVSAENDTQASGG